MDKLTEGQKRAIKSIIMLTEEKLHEMESLIFFIEHTKSTDGIQKEVVNDLTLAEKDMFIKKIAEMKKVLKAFSEHYQLQNAKERISLKNILSVKAAFIWEDISGSTFNRLKSYGDIEEWQRPDYEQFINPLNDLINEIMHIKS
nr:hypothetical protein [uncultured Pedobacter sp.]